MNNDVVKKEKSRLDWFFLFKRGYSSYITYFLGLIDTAGVLLLVVVQLFHVSTLLAGVILLLTAVPAGWLTTRLGDWDFRKGGKKIDVRLHYQNDEVWKGVIMGVYALLRKEGLDKDAGIFKETMLRYGVMTGNE